MPDESNKPQIEIDEETDAKPLSELEEYMEYSKARSPLTERVFYEMSQNLFDKTKIRMISRLNTAQIEDVFKVALVSELFVKRYMNPKSPLYNDMDDIVSILLELTISKDGLGRTEITNLFSGFNLLNLLDPKKKGGSLTGR